MWGASSTHRGQGGLNKKATGEHTLRGTNAKPGGWWGRHSGKGGWPRKGTEGVSLVQPGRQRHTDLHQRTMVVSRTNQNRQRTQKGIFFNR